MRGGSHIWDSGDRWQGSEGPCSGGGEKALPRGLLTPIGGL
jgi:hypothetical protein